MTPSFTPQILADRAPIRLTGENVLDFLHNLLTCDVAGLADRTWAYGALLSPQGKIQHDLFIIRDGETTWLDCAAPQRSDLVKKLLMYRLRADIGLRAIVPAGEAGPGTDYHASRIALGLADSLADIGDNQLFPHEANFDQLNAVSFTKGCYVGQEVVSRMQHKGMARNRIIKVAGEDDLPPKGTGIRAGESLIGETLSSSGRHGLALLRLDRLAEARATLLAEGVRLHVQKPGWMRLDIMIPELAA
jgi:tRNA-modifying protein YgfZ